MKFETDKITYPAGYETWSDEKKAIYDYGYSMARDRLEYTIKEELIRRDWTKDPQENIFPWNMIADVVPDDDGEDTVLPERSLNRSICLYGVHWIFDDLDERQRRAMLLKYYYLQPDDVIASDMNIYESEVGDLIRDSLNVMRNNWHKIECIKVETAEMENKYLERQAENLYDVQDVCLKMWKEGKLPLEVIRTFNISILDLYVPAYNYLYNAGIKTIGNLLDLGSEEELAKIPKMGRKARLNILLKMSDLNLDFTPKQEIEEKASE